MPRIVLATRDVVIKEVIKEDKTFAFTELNVLVTDHKENKKKNRLCQMSNGDRRNRKTVWKGTSDVRVREPEGCKF